MLNAQSRIFCDWVVKYYVMGRRQLRDDEEYEEQEQERSRGGSYLTIVLTSEHYQATVTYLINQYQYHYQQAMF